MSQLTKQEAFGFIFYSSVPAHKIENLEKRLKHMYLRAHWGETDSEISGVNIKLIKRESIPFDWSKADIAGNNFGPTCCSSSNNSHVE